MLFLVEMMVHLPHDLDSVVKEGLISNERDMALRLQEQGKWRHLWRIVGHYANVSVFDVEGHAELHTLLSGLPLFPYMEMTVMPLCRHPSSVHPDDR